MTEETKRHNKTLQRMLVQLINGTLRLTPSSVLRIRKLHVAAKS
jgi:hypothetical protein